MYKIMRGMDIMDSRIVFPRIDMSITRGYRFKVKEGKFEGIIRGTLYTEACQRLECAARGGSRRPNRHISEAS